MSYSIETDRLLLRSFKQTDAESYFQMTSDTAIIQYVPYCREETLSSTTELICDYYMKCDFVRDYYVAIESKYTHELVGAIIAVATKTSPLELDMSILIGANYRRLGYMSEALNAFIQNISRPSYLNFMIERQNIASISTVSKLADIKEIPIFGQFKEDHRAYTLVLK